jgi:hypothetical protein
MKEKLVKYVMEMANKEFADDFPISRIENWIDDFFDQPEIKQMLIFRQPNGEKMTLSMRNKLESAIEALREN